MSPIAAFLTVSLEWSFVLLAASNPCYTHCNSFAICKSISTVSQVGQFSFLCLYRNIHVNTWVLSKYWAKTWSLTLGRAFYMFSHNLTTSLFSAFLAFFSRLASFRSQYRDSISNLLSLKRIRLWNFCCIKSTSPNNFSRSPQNYLIVSTFSRNGRIIFLAFFSSCLEPTIVVPCSVNTLLT